MEAVLPVRAVSSRRSVTRRGQLVYVLGLVLAAAVTPMDAQTPSPPAPFDGEITLEVWSFDDRIIHGDSPPEERLLREAQYTLSGMIFGWDMVYTPEYPARGVERVFLLDSVGGVPWGDPRLSMRAVVDRENTLYGQIDFSLSPTDIQRLRAWRGSETVRAAGTASAPLQQGLPGKITAIEEAIAQAIRDHLRSVTYNRPREVRGGVVLERPPRIRIVSGRYEAQVNILLRIDEIQDYLAF